MEAPDLRALPGVDDDLPERRAPGTAPRVRLSRKERGVLLALLARAPKRLVQQVDVEVLKLKLETTSLAALLTELTRHRASVRVIELARLAGCAREEVSRWLRSRPASGAQAREAAR